MSKRRSYSHADESGVSLILALVFIFAVGMLITAVASFSTGALAITITLNQQRAREANAESAATVAVDYMRFNYVPVVFTPSQDSSTPDCLPPATPTYQGFEVYCWGNESVGSPDSRVINFYVCVPGSSAGWTGFSDPPIECGNVVFLFAKVTFDDLPPNAPPQADDCTTVAAPNPSSCGIVMSVDDWDVRTADN